MTNIRKLKQALATYQKSLNPAKVPFQKHKAALRDLTELLMELAPALLAVAEAAERLTSHAAGNNPINDEDKLIEALNELGAL